MIKSENLRQICQIFEFFESGNFWWLLEGEQCKIGSLSSRYIISQLKHYNQSEISASDLSNLWIFPIWKILVTPVWWQILVKKTLIFMINLPGCIVLPPGVTKNFQSRKIQRFDKCDTNISNLIIECFGRDKSSQKLYFKQLICIYRYIHIIIFLLCTVLPPGASEVD